jgi:hypothetical protein
MHHPPPLPFMPSLSDLFPLSHSISHSLRLSQHVALTPPAPFITLSIPYQYCRFPSPLYSFLLSMSSANSGDLSDIHEPLSPTFSYVVLHSVSVSLFLIITRSDSDSEFMPPNDDLDAPPGPEDISQYPDALATDPGDRPNQSAVMDEIIMTSPIDLSPVNCFDSMDRHPLKLSRLRHFYDTSDTSVLNILSRRNTLRIDDVYRIPTGKGRIVMKTDVTMLDYHLTVGNRIGLSPLLPNANSAHRFCFDMNLRKPHRQFKGKHAMLGFDPKGAMLYIGHSMNEDIFLAMAPKGFLSRQPDRSDPCAPGYSTGSSVMSTRHYRQLVIMIVYFLCQLSERSYVTYDDLYNQDLASIEPQWEYVTDAM